MTDLEKLEENLTTLNLLIQQTLTKKEEVLALLIKTREEIHSLEKTKSTESNTTQSIQDCDTVLQNTQELMANIENDLKKYKEHKKELVELIDLEVTH